MSLIAPEAPDEIVGSSWEQDIGHLLRAVKRAHETIKDTPDPSLLTPPQFVVLLAVSRVPGVDQRTAGELASIDQATVSGVVRRLASRGLLRVEADPVDGRRKLLYVTDTSLEMVRSDSARLRRADDTLLARLSSDDRDALIDRLSRVAYSRAIDPGTRTVGEVATADVFSVAETSRAFGRLLRVCNQLHTSIWRDQVGTFVTPVQYTTLSAIAEEEVNQNTLTARVALNKGTVTELLARLRRNGLIEVRGHPTDRRQQVIAMTAAGRDIFRLTRHAERAVRELLLEPVAEQPPPALDQLLASLLARS